MPLGGSAADKSADCAMKGGDEGGDESYASKGAADRSADCAMKGGDEGGDES